MALSLAVKMGSGATLEGNATVGDVLKGVTFYNDDPSEIKTGTLELTGDASAGDVKSGKTFYNTDAKTIQTGTFSSQEKTVTSSVSAQTVTPDSGKYLSKVTVNKLTMSGTFTTNTRGTAVDMGESNTYRYVNTNGVTNTNSETYTFGSTNGATVDLGATNTYRYVNASKVYAKGKADGDVKHTVKVWQPHSGGGSFDDYEIYVVIDGTTKYHNFANSFGNKSWTV